MMEHVIQADREQAVANIKGDSETAVAIRAAILAGKADCHMFVQAAAFYRGTDDAHRSRTQTEIRAMTIYEKGKADGSKGYRAVPADYSVNERSEYMRGYRDGQKQRAKLLASPRAT